MVRHSTVKTRRRSHKVTRKPRLHPKLRVIKNLSNPLIKPFYDKEKSPAENLKDIGLDINPNGLGQLAASLHAVNPKNKTDSEYSGFVGYVENLPNVNSNKPKNVLTDLETEYIQANIDKHGKDYKAMEKDIKTNYNQYTENQLKKLVTRYESQSQD
jgi:hypothetical protein